MDDPDRGRAPLVLCHGGPRFWDTFDDLERWRALKGRPSRSEAGHLPWVEQPAAFRAAVAGFLLS